MRTFHLWLSDPFVPFLTALNNLLLTDTRFVLPLYRKLFHHFFRGSLVDNGKHVFEEHYSMVRSSVPNDKTARVPCLRRLGAAVQVSGMQAAIDRLSNRQ